MSQELVSIAGEELLDLLGFCDQFKIDYPEMIEDIIECEEKQKEIVSTLVHPKNSSDVNKKLILEIAQEHIDIFNKIPTIDYILESIDMSYSDVTYELAMMEIFMRKNIDLDISDYDLENGELCSQVQEEYYDIIEYSYCNSEEVEYQQKHILSVIKQAGVSISFECEENRGYFNDPQQYLFSQFAEIKEGLYINNNILDIDMYTLFDNKCDVITECANCKEEDVCSKSA
ncbi:MAG: hypothetical protein RR420_01420 [Anaerovoracaceae bacterium]